MRWAPHRGLGPRDAHTAGACTVLGQRDPERPPAHRTVRQKQRLLAAGWVCPPTPPLPSSLTRRRRDWTPEAQCPVGAAVFPARAVGKGGTGSHFTDVETEAQRGDGTRSRSQGQASTVSESHRLPRHGGQNCRGLGYAQRAGVCMRDGWAPALCGEDCALCVCSRLCSSHGSGCR